MILDTSAVVAIFCKEPGFDALVDKLAAVQGLGMGTPTMVETAIVLTARLREDATGLLERFLQEFVVELVPFGVPHWREAHDAYLRFGKGRHRAQLNFGDCMSYATAKLAGRPLLCVGEDFRRTDIEIA